MGVNKVTVRGVDGSHRDFALTAGPLAIGRDPASHIHLNDSQVSWKHAVLISDASGCVIEDLGSSNGTFVGAHRIQRHVVHPGERIKIGPYELMLQKEQDASAPGAVEQAGAAIEETAEVRDWRSLLKRLF